MNRDRQTYGIHNTSAATHCETVLLGRLGTELGKMYGDTLNAPLPASLQLLIDRLHEAVTSDSCGCDPRRTPR